MTGSAPVNSITFVVLLVLIGKPRISSGPLIDRRAGELTPGSALIRGKSGRASGKVSPDDSTPLLLDSSPRRQLKVTGTLRICWVGVEYVDCVDFIRGCESLVCYCVPLETIFETQQVRFDEKKTLVHNNK